ncbi:MAG: ATP-binding domain-containing protein [Firmicutes bacterium]|nr:ATP-binding domain-containing protein [Bacillota bacterium]
MSEQDELSLEREHLASIQAHIAQDIEHMRSHIHPTEDYAEAVIQSRQLGELEQLEKSHLHPYFARVSFTEQTEYARANPLPEVAYIGRFGLFDRTTLTPLVLDWRSPMANLYYDDAFRSVPVQVDGGHQLQFDVAQKRQFEIERGALQRYFDSTSAVRTDQLLLSRLEERGEQKLRDIVETIQAEQNRIIRAPARQVLVVQGVAGSGKTTIALHRLSYLAYHHRDQRSFANFLILAPNRLFIDYIADVLPDLGVEGVRQHTFADFVLSVLPGKWRLAKNPPVGDDTTAMWLAKVRTSLSTKDMLDAIIEQYVLHMLPERDFVLDSGFTMSHAEVAKKFFEDYRHYPFMTRRKRLVKALTQFTEDAIQARVAQIDRLAKRIGYAVAEERQEKLTTRYRELCTKYCKQIRSVDLLELYRRVIGHEKNITWVLKRLAVPVADIPQLATNIALALRSGQKGRAITEEDLAPLLYLQARLFGLDKAPKFSHIVVDEAQDLAPLQLSVLTLFMNQSSMSLFGDMAQTIYPHKGLTSWEEILDAAFDGPCELTVLHQSYRSTVEIMDVANHVIKHWSYDRKTLAVPVLRHGPVPKQIMTEDREKALAELTVEIARYQAQGLINIAVIDKTTSDCEHLAQDLLQAGVASTLLSESSQRYAGGVSVLSVQQSKGMEFDAVILIDPTAAKYEAQSDTDMKLLYVAITRALHRLCVIHWQPLTPLLYGAPITMTAIEG